VYRIKTDHISAKFIDRPKKNRIKYDTGKRLFYKNVDVVFGKTCLISVEKEDFRTFQ
jgi:hypothetical protein